MTSRDLTALDRLLIEADSVLRTLSRRGASAARPSPAEGHSEARAAHPLSSRCFCGAPIAC